MQVKKQQLELDMEQWTGSKLRKEYNKAIYCYSAYLILLLYVEKIMQNAGVDETSWSQDCGEKHQQPQCRWCDYNGGKCEAELKSFLMRMKGESKKAALKLKII